MLKVHHRYILFQFNCPFFGQIYNPRSHNKSEIRHHSVVLQKQLDLKQYAQMKCTVNQPINLIRTYFAACSVHIRIEWCFFCNVDYYPVRYYIISTLGRRFEQNKANEEKKRLLIENEVITLKGRI